MFVVDRHLLTDLTEIIEQIEDIFEWTEGLSSGAQIHADRMLFKSVVKSFDVLGDNVSQWRQYRADFFTYVTSNYKHIAWNKIIGMRNITVHDTRIVDCDILLSAARNNLPELLAVITELKDDVHQQIVEGESTKPRSE